MKTLLIILVLAAVGLSVLAVRRETMVRIDKYSTTFLVDCSNSRVVAQDHEGMTAINLRPYAQGGLLLVSAAILGLIVSRRKKKK